MMARAGDGRKQMAGTHEGGGEQHQEPLEHGTSHSSINDPARPPQPLFSRVGRARWVFSAGRCWLLHSWTAGGL